jgi:hypothetical protein
VSSDVDTVEGATGVEGTYDARIEISVEKGLKPTELRD